MDAIREPNKLQRTGTWHSDRTGKLTASRMSAAMAFLKPKKDPITKKLLPPEEAKERFKLRYDLITERMRDEITWNYITPDMQHGIDNEPLAKQVFEERTGLLITDVGFIDHPTINWCGCSPDGYVSDGRLIEIKCPRSTTHFQWVKDGVVPEEHHPQLLLQLACTGKSETWFVSFDPRLKPHEQIYIKKFSPPREKITEVEIAAVNFLNEVETLFDFFKNHAVYFDEGEKQ